MSDSVAWTDDQVASLNGFQDAGMFHPFTCGGAGCSEVLIAQNDGWHCPKCSYRQFWAHTWMLDWSWKNGVNPLGTAGVR